MNRSSLIGLLLLTGCFEPVDVGSHDAGSDGGTTPCVVGMDQTCNELTTMSSLAGTCTPTGCTCNSGFERGPTGTCRPVGSCPSTPQQPGGACSIAGLVCEYGYSPPECVWRQRGRTVRCNGSAWTEVMHSDPQLSCNRDAGPVCGCDYGQRCLNACAGPGERCVADRCVPGLEPTCTGSAPFTCLMGTSGGLCGDGPLMAICAVNGTWGCPAGTIPSTQCACIGLRPGCTCSATGWSCPPVVCTFGVDMSCNDVSVDGGVGGIAGTCSATGICACLAGFELNPVSRTCRPITAAVCTGAGLDQACNELQIMSSFAGTCVSGRCVCNTGFELALSGRCQPVGAVCSDRIAPSCNDGPVDGGVRAIAGSCVVGTCACNAGFEVNPATGRCRESGPAAACTVGMDQTCNANLGMSALAGTCVAGVCQCSTGFALSSNGKCTASSTGFCVVSDGMGRCTTEALDGGAAGGGLCGSVGISEGCSCAGSPPMPRCGGLCPPTAGRTCVTTNCGSINCVPPLRCTGTNICSL